MKTYCFFLTLDKIAPEIRQRFNPCIFLAEYLMRNNPNRGSKLEYADLFEQLARVEKIRRFFIGKRQKIFKHFTLQPYHTNFCQKDVKDYVEALDILLCMDRKLTHNFDVDEYFPEDPEEQIGFDHFWDTMVKWATEQNELTYEEFAVIDLERKEKLEDYKKGADKVI